VFAGPNGAGKSSLVGRFRVENYMPTVNPDTIARALAPDRQGEPALMLKAGRIAAVQRRDHIHAGRSFALETTLTGIASCA
jgi:predicted ABC-type ATPase